MIRILEKHVADKIAAGEVVDRPVSIVKELLENALDAGADAVTVQIQKGGKDYIRVTDNGCGIPAEEAETAFARHATSKIVSAKDLDSIGTLGFRGEALASICAVSRVELITKTATAKAGRKVVVEGSEILENAPTGCPDGTTITVRDLFYNTPARRKFLATDSAETRRIIDMVSRIALSYTDVRFSLLNGSETVFTTQGKGSIRSNIVSVYGSRTGKDLLPVENRSGDMVLKGFISPPSVNTPSRTRQIFCVNGRVVSSKVMERGLEAAYREKLFSGRFPIAFLFLALPPEKLDVNIHPTKKEVRFDDPYQVEDFIRDSVAEALQVKEALPRIQPKAGPAVAEEGASMERPAPETETGRMDAQTGKIDTQTDTIGVQTGTRSTQTGTQVDIKSLLATLREETEAVKDAGRAFPEQARIQEPTQAPSAANPEAPGKRPDAETDLSDAAPGKPIVTPDRPVLSPDEPASRPFELEALDYLGTLFNTYLMAADEDSFYLIDQHAAHERIFYEKLLSQYNREDKPSQQLLLPLTFQVSPGVTAGEDAWLEQVRDLGYDVEFFGNHTYRVREIPAFMELKEAEAFLWDLFEALEDKPDLTNARILEKLIMRSCKSAVKGGDHLEEAEIQALLKDLKQCVNPFSCPHGRPTFIHLTKYELEKLFKRV